MPSGIKFPEKLTLEEMEILLKEWELAGCVYTKADYYLGFSAGKDRWEALYLKLFPSGEWVISDKVLDKEAAFELRKVTWVGHYWATTESDQDAIGKALGIYVVGEVDYKLEEYLLSLHDSEPVELDNAEGVAWSAEQNVRECLSDVTRVFMNELSTYSED